MAETILDELRRYVEFGTEDEARLRALHPHAAPHFERIAKVFYDRILTHEGARLALESGDGQVSRLEVTLQAWMDRLLSGPWDQSYYDTRARIGRVHVRIQLPQHYMLGAMNVLRRELESVADVAFQGRPTDLAATRTALGKILDLELAIMLHSYREDLLEERAKLERLSTFGQLVGFIGHELRNPLSVIETSLHLLRGRLPDSDERITKHLDRIGSQLLQANDIIGNLLDLVRDRARVRSPVDVGSLIRELTGAVERPERVSLSLSGLDDLPPVHGDAIQLRQVFRNLLANAVEATAPEGEVRVDGRSSDGFLELAVEDSGPGVDPEVRRRLFEPLVTTKERGIGLGLALVRRFVEQHGGSVELDRSYGPGARFRVRLPVQAA